MHQQPPQPSTSPRNLSPNPADDYSETPGALTPLTSDWREFPVLQGVSFHDILEWELDLARILRQAGLAGVNIRLGPLVSIQVAELWEISTGRRFPTHIADGIPELYAVFRPPTVSTLLSILRSFTWFPPTSSTLGPRKNTQSMMEFNNRYARAVAGLGLNNSVAVDHYHRALRGPFGESIRELLSTTTATPELTAVMREGLRLATQADNILNDNFVMKFASSCTSNDRLNHNRSNHHYDRPPQHPNSQSRVSLNLAPLTQQERYSILDAGGCLRCRALDHQSHQCPHFSQTQSYRPQQTTPMSTQSSAYHRQPQTPQQRPLQTTYPRPQPHPTYPPTTPTPSRAIASSSVMTAASRSQPPRPLQVQRPRLDRANAHRNNHIHHISVAHKPKPSGRPNLQPQQRSPNDNPHLVWVEADLPHPDYPDTIIKCALDTGASLSVVSKPYLDKNWASPQSSPNLSCWQ